MAGLSPTGFEIKRFPEVVTELKNNAVTVFQDLVPPGDIVDTSDSSTIGRIIALHAPQYSDLWELAQQVYAAFDPNSSSGIALDNLVALNGTVRNPASATTADVVLWGSEGVMLPGGTEARATNNDDYTIEDSLVFSLVNCVGFQASLSSVVVGTEYVIEITRVATTFSLSYTALAGDTVQDVLNQLYSQIVGNTLFNASVSGTTLLIEAASIYVPLVVVTNLLTPKIKISSTARNQNIGAYPLDANSLTTILTPVLGWDSITNPFLGDIGSDEETDDELRSRFSQNKYISAVNINESLYSALINIEGVQEVRVVENNTSAYDPVFDLPGHSFKPIVLGGDPDAIAAAVWLNQPLGIGSEGNTDVQIVDSQGYPQLISFERPDSVPIYIEMEIESTGTMAVNTPDLIRQELVKYFSGMRLGQEVVYSRLFTPINTIPGFQVNSMAIGTAPSPTGTANISLDYNEYATIDPEDIEITVV